MALSTSEKNYLKVLVIIVVGILILLVMIAFLNGCGGGGGFRVETTHPIPAETTPVGETASPAPTTIPNTIFVKPA